MDLLMGSENPVGSLAYLGETGLDPRSFASCSAPQGVGKSLGCPVWDKCKFRFKGERPQFVAIGRIYRVNGSGKTSLRNCYDAVQHDLPRRSNDPDAAYTISIVGYEGDKVEITESKRTHEKPNPECEACRDGKCSARETVIIEKQVPVWKPPTERLVRANHAQNLMERMRADVEREGLASQVGATMPPLGPGGAPADA